MEVRPCPDEYILDMALVKGKGGYMVGTAGIVGNQERLVGRRDRSNQQIVGTDERTGVCQSG